MNISTKDTAVVSAGLLTPFPTPLNVDVDLNDGWHFNLQNQIWGTNYVMWYPFEDGDKN